MVSEVLGNEEGLEVQVLDGRREVLKKSFRRENMEGMRETIITGRKPESSFQATDHGHH